MCKNIFAKLIASIASRYLGHWCSWLVSITEYSLMVHPGPTKGV